MKYTTIISLILLPIISSCTHITPPIHSTTTSTPILNEETIWNILDHAAFESWTKEKVENYIGKPSLSYQEKNKDQQEETIYIYKDLSTGIQIWSVQFNHENILSALTYLPSEDQEENFTIEQIKKHWEKFGCENRTKKIVYADYIKDISYLDCENGKRIVETDQYNEVISLSVIN